MKIYRAIAHFCPNNIIFSRIGQLNLKRVRPFNGNCHIFSLIIFYVFLFGINLVNNDIFCLIILFYENFKSSEKNTKNQTFSRIYPKLIGLNVLLLEFYHLNHLINP